MAEEKETGSVKANKNGSVNANKNSSIETWLQTVCILCITRNYFSQFINCNIYFHL